MRAVTAILAPKQVNIPPLNTAKDKTIEGKDFL